MRRLLVLLLTVAGLSSAGFAQEKQPKKVLGQYRLALLDQFKRVMVYPKDALELEIEGKVVVQLSVGADGGIKSSKVGLSSGYAVLDTAALEMVRKAHPLAILPEPLRGKSFDVAVPVTFRIKRE